MTPGPKAGDPCSKLPSVLSRGREAAGGPGGWRHLRRGPEFRAAGRLMCDFQLLLFTWGAGSGVSRKQQRSLLAGHDSCSRMRRAGCGERGEQGLWRAGGTWGSSLMGLGRESCMVRHSHQSQSCRGIISPNSLGNTGLGCFGRKLSGAVQAAQRPSTAPGDGADSFLP